MRLRLLSLLLIVKVCRLNTVSPDVCPPLSHWKLTKPLNTRDSYQENESLRYQCVDGYVRKAGTSNLIKCKRIGQVLQWTLPTLICIPDPSIPTTIEHSVTETQEVITTVTVTTTIISDITSVPVDKSSAVTSVSTKTVSPSESYCFPNRTPTPSEDPGGDESTGKSSATAIYAGVGGVIVTILLVAVFGVLMFWRRKRMQRFALSPTPDEIMQMNVVT
ncbi:interleukin-15 receptor subunit alpha isoform X3 [Oncorhynchus tshawytscha]|uniref:interleukin-15 receptor subunit alpha isoform X3 n=1 Tax=Oncorhynchus tshawytscha TaxID=74940 RepID=UPI000D0A26BA|nr:interleukin-15 receptor subunit alpha isoform X3 [Oncorhynchus tshawytscha]